jgi:hypothetical protein
LELEASELDAARPPGCSPWMIGGSYSEGSPTFDLLADSSQPSKPGAQSNAIIASAPVVRSLLRMKPSLRA